MGLFLLYCAEFGKEYSTVGEMKRRAAIFFEKDRYIRDRNAKENRNVVSHNKFSDWSNEEYRSILKSKGTTKTLRKKSAGRRGESETLN